MFSQNIVKHYVSQFQSPNSNFKMVLCGVCYARIIHNAAELNIINKFPFFAVPDRPKRLLVLLNPASGKFKGQEIYEKVAAPLFEMAGVETNIIGTSRNLNGILQHFPCFCYHIPVY